MESSSLRAGVGDDLIDGGGITDGSLFGGTGNDSFDFTGGEATGFVDAGSGVDSVLLGSTADTITLTGALTSTSVTAGGGADSLVVKANVSSGYFDISGGTSDTLIFQSVSAVGTTIKGGLDADLVSLYGANDLVLNNFSGDTLMAGTGADTLLFTVWQPIPQLLQVAVLTSSRWLAAVLKVVTPSIWVSVLTRLCLGNNQQ